MTLRPLTAVEQAQPRHTHCGACGTNRPARDGRCPVCERVEVAWDLECDLNRPPTPLEITFEIARRHTRTAA